MRLLSAILAWMRRLLGRRRARALLAESLPRGITAPSLRIALREPAEEAPGEYSTLLSGAQIVRGTKPRPLVRLPALPRPPYPLSVVRVDAFRLDTDFRLPPERDAAATLPDLPPPAPERRPPRPRTPLARAPLTRLDPRAFRLDPRALTLANEEGVPLARPPIDAAWLLPSFRREKIDPRWMASRRLLGLSPFHAEWFAMWWEQSTNEVRGPAEPRDFAVPDDLWVLMREVKEQMLIRRDVVKDEDPPPEQKFIVAEGPRPIEAHSRVEVRGLVPPKEWYEALELPKLPRVGAQRAEAYLQWRTLMDALADG